MNCANCAAKIEDSLKKNNQLSSVEFSFATKRLVVESAIDTSAYTLIKSTVDSIEDGVSVDLPKPRKKTVKKHVSTEQARCSDGCCSSSEVLEHEHAHEAGHYHNLEHLHDLEEPDVLEHSHVLDHEQAQIEGDWISILKGNRLELVGFFLLLILVLNNDSIPYISVGYLTAYLLIGGDVIKRALKNLLKGKLFDENFLMTIATIGAFLLNEYVEAVAVMLFYKIGEAFQDYAVDYSRRNIESLLDIKAEFANLLNGSSIVKVDPSELEIGSSILIRAGEKVPVDCIITKGEGYVDTSALTGESLPSFIKEGDRLLSGTIVTDASLTGTTTELLKIRPYRRSLIWSRTQPERRRRPNSSSPNSQESIRQSLLSQPS